MPDVTTTSSDRRDLTFSAALARRAPEHLVPIQTGLTFAFFDQVLTFEVKATGAAAPFIAEFLVQRNKDKKPYQVELVGAAPESIRIAFSNPTEGGVSGLLNPMLIVAAGGKAVAFMFYVDVVNNNAGTYRLTYEFYEAPFPGPKAEEGR